MSRAKPLAVTMGDPAGIGGEITIGAWRAKDRLSPFFLIDDPSRIRSMSGDVPVSEIAAPDEAAAVFPNALPVLPIDVGTPVCPGIPSPGTARATIEAIERAVYFARLGAVSGIVTNPINKKLLQDGAEFRHPGHTEFLAELGGVSRTVMMLTAPGLRVVPVTIHIPIAEVPDALTRELIVETARITKTALIQDFGIEAPRLAVAGLNPHAGEGGTIGAEDASVIAPAIADLRSDGTDVSGPLPADTMFHPAARERYDVALCMYHDQALIPVKMLDFERGVNVTLGLPFVRTSPDHGTAYDIAGKNTASPASMIEALRVARDMAGARNCA